MIVLPSQQKLVENSRWLDYLIVSILLVIMSGNPAFMGEARREICTVLASSLFLTILIVKRKTFPADRFVIGIFVFGSVLLIQCIGFGFWPLYTITGFILRLFVAYAAVRIVNEFPLKYISIMYYTCLVSWLFLWLPVAHLVAGVDLIKLFSPLDRIANPYRGFNFFVHNFVYYARVRDGLQNYALAEWRPFRNSSCFWEPGVLAAYILLAIVFLGLVKDKLDVRRYKRILAVLIITLLTTMSTTGYLLLPLSLLFHIRGTLQNINELRKTLAIVLILLIFGGIAFQLNFIGGKIKRHGDAITYREESWERTRMGSLLYDLEYITRRPFFGWGLAGQTRYMLSSGEGVRGMGNGLSDFTAKLGLTGILTFFACSWISVYRLSKNDWRISTLFIFFVALVLNGEQLLEYPAYLTLMFLEPAVTGEYAGFAYSPARPGQDYCMS